MLVPFGFSDTWRLGFQANTALHGSREGCSAEKINAQAARSKYVIQKSDAVVSSPLLLAFD
jgi:hypothetical protein